MSPEETQVLKSLGQAFLLDLGIICCHAGLYGIYLTLTSLAMFQLWRRGLRTKATVIPFLALVAVFIAFTAALMSGIALTSLVIRGALVENISLPIEGRLRSARSGMMGWGAVQSWVFGNAQGILFWIGDAVVVWRACVMFPHHKLMRYALISFYLWGVAFAIAAQIYITVKLPTSQTIELRSPAGIMELLSSLYFILVNALATVLIAWQVYRYRQQLEGTFCKERSTLASILILLVESGAVYCVIQTIALILGSLDNETYSPVDWANKFWSLIALFALAIFPVVTILVVNSRQSIADVSGMTEKISNAGPSMHFAVPQLTVDDSRSTINVAAGDNVLPEIVNSGRLSVEFRRDQDNTLPAKEKDWLSGSAV